MDVMRPVHGLSGPTSGNLELLEPILPVYHHIPSGLGEAGRERAMASSDFPKSSSE